MNPEFLNSEAKPELKMPKFLMENNYMLEEFSVREDNANFESSPTHLLNKIIDKRNKDLKITNFELSASYENLPKKTPEKQNLNAEDWLKLESKSEADPYFLELVEMMPLEKILMYIQIRSDENCFYALILVVLKKLRVLHQISKDLASTRYFRLFSKFLVFLNCLFLTLKENDEYRKLMVNIIQTRIFLYFYIIEFFIKFLVFPITYIKDIWRFMEIMIILLSLIDLSNLGLENTIEILTLIRLLKSLKEFFGGKVQIIFNSLVASSRTLIEMLFLLSVFFIAFTIIGFKLFSKAEACLCIIPETGKSSAQFPFCQDELCPKGLIPSEEIFQSSNFNTFETFPLSILQVIVTLSLDGWSSLMEYTVLHSTKASALYFISIILFGHFLIVNMTLVILKAKFTEAQNYIESKGVARNEIRNSLDLQELKSSKMWARSKRNALFWYDNSRKFIGRKRREESFTATTLTKENFEKSKTISMRRASTRRKFFKSKVYPTQTFVSEEELRRKRNSSFVTKFYSFFAGEPNEFVEARFLKVELKKDRNYYPTSEKEILKQSMEKKFKAKKLKEKYYHSKAMLIKTKYELRDVYYLQEIEAEKIIHTKRAILSNSKTEKKFGRLLEHTLKELKFPKLYFKVKKRKIPVERKCIFYLKRRNKANSKFKSSKMFKALPSLMELSPVTKLIDPSKSIAHTIKKEQRMSRAKITRSFSTYEKAVKNFNHEEPELELGKSEDIVYQEDQKENYRKIIISDAELNLKRDRVWSGDEILTDKQMNNSKLNMIFESLNKRNFNIWKRGFSGKLGHLILLLNNFLATTLYLTILYLLLSAFLLNLMMIGVYSWDTVDSINKFFNYIFIVDTMAKLFCVRFRKFLRDKLNILDLIIVTLFFLDNSLTLLNYGIPDVYMRFVGALRVLRVLRLFNSFRFTRMILKVLGDSFSSFSSLVVLILIYNLVYSIIGIKLFRHTFDQKAEIYIRYNFDTFLTSFFTVFNVLFLDNWTDILKMGWYNENGPLVIILFVVSWMFIGNFLLMNLFQAILMDYVSEGIKKYYEKGKSLIKDDKKNLEPDPDDPYSNYNKKELLLALYHSNQNKDSPISSKTSPMGSYLFQDDEKSENFSSRIDFELAKRSFLRSKTLTMIFDFKALQGYFSNIAFRFHNFRFHSEIISFFVLLYTLAMILKTYENGGDSNNYNSPPIYITIFKSIANSVVFVDLILLMVFNGVIFEKESFFRSKANIFQFMLCLINFVDIMEESNLITTRDNYLKHIVIIVQSLQLLNMGLKSKKNIRIFLEAIINSIGGIINVTLFIITIWIFFAIIGVFLFKDRFGYCESPLNMRINLEQCVRENKEWINSPLNFDDIRNAMLSLFAISTFNGYVQILSTAVNSGLPSTGPIQFNNQYSAYFFFMIFMFIGCILLMNLFLGAIIYNFTKARKTSDTKFLTDSQEIWIKLIQKISKVELRKFDEMKTVGRFSQLAMKLLQKGILRSFVYLINGATLFMMILEKNSNSNDKYTRISAQVELLCIIISLFEISLRAISIGLRPFFTNLWSAVDVIIVFINSFDPLWSIVIPDKYVKYFNIVKALKIFRFLIIMPKNSGVRKLIVTICYAIPYVFSISMIFVMVLFMYAMIGWNYLQITGKEDFDTFIDCLITLMKIGTADDWMDIMRETANMHGKFWNAYFISFYFIFNFFIINLFLLVIYEQFELYYLNVDNALHNFEENLESFRNSWNLYSEKSILNRNYISERNIVTFLKSLKGNMSVGQAESYEQYALEICTLGINKRSEGSVHFLDMLYACFHRVYYKKLILNEVSNIWAEMKIDYYEKKVRTALEVRKQRDEVYKKRIITVMNGESIVKSKNFEQVVNPLRHYYYFLMSFYTWQKFSDQIAEDSEMKINRKQKIMKGAKEISSSGEIYLTSSETPLPNKLRAYDLFMEVTESSKLFLTSRNVKSFNDVPIMEAVDDASDEEPES